MAEPKRHKVGRAIVGWLIVAAVAAAPAYYYLFVREEVVEVTAAVLRRGRVEDTVSAISAGTVKPRSESMVASGYVGKVAVIPVKEGDRVQEGEVLIELEHAELDAQVALAEANLRVGLSRQEQAKIAAKIYAEIAETRVNQTAAQLKVAQQEYDRIRTMADRQAVSESNMDKVTLALQVSTEARAAAVAAQQENLVRQEDIRSAAALIEQLEAAVTAAKVMRDKAFVHAPFDGVVARILVDIGEAVGSGLGGGLGSMGGMGGLGGGAGTSAAAPVAGASVASPMTLVHLVQEEGFYVEAPFDEANASEIAVGQPARIEIDAYRGLSFPGTVEFISPVVSLNMDLSRTLDVDIRIDEGEDKFMAGMSADVIIVATEKDDVLFVPSDALIREELGYVIEDGRAVKRNVEVGIGNFVRREVLSGLEDGETLITSVTTRNLKDGVRVRVVDSLD